jgi:hypothetical protein
MPVLLHASAIFWLFLINYDGSFCSMITDILSFEQGKYCFEHKANKQSSFGLNEFNSSVVFMLIDGALGQL